MWFAWPAKVVDIFIFVSKVSFTAFPDTGRRRPLKKPYRGRLSLFAILPVCFILFYPPVQPHKQKIQEKPERETQKGICPQLAFIDGIQHPGGNGQRAQRKQHVKHRRHYFARVQHAPQGAVNIVQYAGDQAAIDRRHKNIGLVDRGIHIRLLFEHLF
jgi:hypothetical protein